MFSDTDFSYEDAYKSLMYFQKKKDEVLKLVEEKIKEIFGNKVDIIIGGPPCQGFSSANRNKVDDDPRNKLFFQFVKFVDVFKPKVVVIENVRGIVTENNGYAKKEIYIDYEKGEKIDIDYKIYDLRKYGRASLIFLK